MLASDAQLVALAQHQIATRKALGARLQGAMAQLWATHHPISDRELAGFLAAAVPLAVAGRRVAATTAASYLTTYARAATGTAVAQFDPVAIAADVRGGVPLEDVYSRPTITARTALSNGADITQALADGAARLDSTIQADAMLAARGAAKQNNETDQRIVGWRRVPSGSACAFCATASTQRYHSSDLMACHLRCHCTVAPIYGTKDPGHVIDRDLVDRLKAPDIPTHGPAFVVHDHGELGPTLASPGDHFTGPAAISANA